MHEALPRRGATHLKRGGFATIEEDGRAPRIVQGGSAAYGNLVIYAVATASALISMPSGSKPVST